MHAFHFTYKAFVPMPGVGEEARILRVSVNHNGDWSGAALLSVVSTPAHFRSDQAEVWFAKLPPEEAARMSAQSAVDARMLLNGDIDPAGQPWLIARVLGPLTAQSVTRYLTNKMRAALDDIWIPQVLPASKEGT